MTKWLAILTAPSSRSGNGRAIRRLLGRMALGTGRLYERVANIDTDHAPTFFNLFAELELKGAETLRMDDVALLERAGATAVSFYAVEPHIVRSSPATRRSAEQVTLIALFRGRSDIPPTAVRTLYRDHVAVALRAHVGMDGYVQHVVTDILPAGAPDFFGCSLLHFPSACDYIQRHYASDTARAMVQADSDRFVDRSFFASMVGRASPFPRSRNAMRPIPPAAA